MFEVALTLLIGLIVGGVQAWWRFGRARPVGVAATAWPLRVRAVVRETPRAVSLELEPLGDPVSFTAGQFLNVRLSPSDPWRSYSLSRPPGEPLRLTVQEKPEGALSPRLVRLSGGEMLEARGPFGGFVVRPGRERIGMIAGGSGITPIWAMIKGIVREGDRPVDLIYGSRSPEETIFLSEIQRLAARSPDRLRVVALWAQGGQEVAPITALSGRLDGAGIRAAWEILGSPNWPEAYLCGPDGARAAARSQLAALAPRCRIIEEQYAPRSAAGAGTAAQAIWMSSAGPRPFPVSPGEPLLSAARRAGLSLPSGCEVGACGACRVRVLAGSVTHPDTGLLSADAREAGAALSCVGCCDGDVTFELDQ